MATNIRIRSRLPKFVNSYLAIGMYPKTIQKLIDLFSKFPGVGPKTAARFVFYLTKQNEKEIQDLSKTISSLKSSLKTCNFCFNLFDASTSSTQEGKEGLCKICSSPSRDRSLLCVVEKETDLVSIEKSRAYKGLYFVLGGTVSTLKTKELKLLRIRELRERIKNPEKFGISGASFKEIIIATNLTVEGEATALFLERKLKDLGKKITRLGRGLPVGGELEYADKETLSSAFRGRR